MQMVLPKIDDDGKRYDGFEQDDFHSRRRNCLLSFRDVLS